ncbi:MAG TPA: MFS transporter [Phototrophicaceae bacterium]|nr:MFS transporter [Phototrophicaceae bacterium]
MRKYLIIWFGEVVSTVGSALTSFALGVWIYERTGSVSLFSLNLLVYAVLGLAMMPLAGVAADRWNRKWVMLVADAGLGVVTLVVFLLAASDQLQIWHVYCLTGVSAALGTFQWPAYKALIPQIVPKAQLGRASGLSQVGDALAELFGPTVAGSLYVLSGVGLNGILLIDFVTFLFATAILLLVSIPRQTITLPAGQKRASVFQDFHQGWLYITERPGLVGLLVYFLIFNFFLELIYPLALPLLYQVGMPDAAGQAMSIMAVGMLVGIAGMGVWGGPRRRIHGILIPGILSGLAIAVAGLQPSLVLITLGGFGYYALLPISQGSDQALWQTKVAPEVQGRVFAIRSAITYSVRPLALLLAGPLADNLFEPLMSAGGGLAGTFGPIFGVGPGRGLGLLITLLGLLSAAAALSAYFFPRIRRVEADLPDVV